MAMATEQALSSPNARMHSELSHNDAQMLTRGQILGNRFVVDYMLNVGGFGQVFVARDPCKSGRPVAVKVESLKASIPLLHAEAKCLQQLTIAGQGSSSTPVVCFQGYGSTETIMDLLGRNVRQLKKQMPADRFSLATSLWLMREMMGALEFVHRAGWIHGDVKPPNFCVSAWGPRRLLLVDFGMSRTYLESDGSMKRRRDSEPFHGTLRYASPRSHHGSDVCRWDDLWAIFFITVENMLGSLPWRHSNDKGVVGTIKSTVDVLGAPLWGSVRPPYSLIALRETLTRADADTCSFYCAPPYEALLRHITTDLSMIGWNDEWSLLDWQAARIPPATPSIPAPPSPYMGGDAGCPPPPPSTHYAPFVQTPGGPPDSVYFI